MRCLLVAAAMAAVSARAHAGNPLDKPAFSATPKELLDAAKAARGGDTDGMLLRRDVTLSFDDRGRLTERVHSIALANDSAAVDEWSHAWVGWRPWRSSRPVYRARTISLTGEVHDLDPASLLEEADRAGEGRHVRGELTVASGTLVEEEWAIPAVKAAPGGDGMMVPMEGSMPTASLHVVIDGPAALKLHVVARGLPKTAVQRHTTAAGRESWTFDLTNLSHSGAEEDLPLDVAPKPYLVVSAARSWNDVAKDYAALIAPKLAVELPPELHAGNSLAVAKSVTAWLHQHVRYTGVDLIRAPLDAVDHAQTIKRGTGNASEVGLLEAALLRAAGIDAEVVLVDRGPLRGSDPDVPMIDGFDHILVHATIAGADTWIDPEDADAPVGRVDVDSQGRPAVSIARAAFTFTPRAKPDDNTVHEIRTFAFADLGSGKVTEVGVSTGQFDFDRRAWLRRTGDAAAHADLVDFAKQRYGGELTTGTYETADREKPITLTTVIANAGYIRSSWLDVSLDLHPLDVFGMLPWTLHHAAAKERVNDLAIDSPYRYEIENRVAVPAGFVIPAVTAETKRTLGFLTLVEQQRVEGRTWIVTYRLDVTKTRLPAAEVNATRKAILEFERAPIHVVMKHEAWALVDDGKYREGVARMAAIVAEKPRSAIEHARYAQLLIKVGDGEGARREGRKAVDLAPKSADVHSAYGWVLTFDLTGRRWASGFDHEGARKELMLAHALAPKHEGVAWELGQLLERGSNGLLNGGGSDMRAAADAFRAAYDVDPSTRNGLSVLRAQLISGDAAGAEATAALLPPSTDRDKWLLAARVIVHGVPAALHDFTSDDRSKVIREAASNLMLVREYDKMRELVTAADVSDGSAFHKQVIAKLQRSDPPPKSSADPKVAALGVWLDDAAACWDAKTADEVRALTRKSPMMTYLNVWSPAVAIDLLRSVSTVKVDGDASAWRVAFDFGGDKTVIYLAMDRGNAKVIGLPGALAGIGRHVARLIGKHDDAAQRLLDWVAADVPHHELRFVWSDALPKDTVHMTAAAALLAHDPDHDIAAGTACGMTTVEGQHECDEMVARGLKARGKWAELEAYATTWIGRAPAAYVVEATANRAIALAQLGRVDAMDKLVEDTLAAHPDDPAILFLRMDVAAFRGQRDEMARRADAAAKAAKSPMDYNNIAWGEYIVDADTPGALERAREAFLLAPKDAAIANTLAALEAASGDSKSAVDHLRASLELAHKEAPNEADWLVLGRIYEDLGLRDDAIAAYRRIAAPKIPDALPTMYSVASARLKALGALGAPKK